MDNAVKLDMQLWYVRKPEVQSKVHILGVPPAAAAEAAVQVEHQLNLAKQIRKMAMRIDCRFLATSDALTEVLK